MLRLFKFETLQWVSLYEATGRTLLLRQARYNSRTITGNYAGIPRVCMIRGRWSTTPRNEIKCSSGPYRQRFHGQQVNPRTSLLKADTCWRWRAWLVTPSMNGTVRKARLPSVAQCYRSRAIDLFCSSTKIQLLHI